MKLPLDGIKVLDLSLRGPGPFCTMILSDLGAEVIKIEPFDSKKGVPTFSSIMFPSRSFEEDEMGKENVFLPFDRNKKSVLLNLKMSEGKEVFYRLIHKSDILLESFRPNVAKRLAVDYETIYKLNPSIIYCSLSAYGQDGPYMSLPGHDINFISFGGALSLIGTPEGSPTIPLNLIGDYAGALYAVIAIVAALLSMGKNEKGQYIDIALTEAVISLMSPIISLFHCYGLIPKIGDNLLTGGIPCYNVYRTKDGKYISIGCLEPRFWENLCNTLGKQDFTPYQFAEGDKKQEIFAFLTKTFKSKTRDEWFEELKDKEVCISKVYSVEEICYDPQVLHRGVIEVIHHPKFGEIKQVRSPFLRILEPQGKIKNLPPISGQNTEEILFDLGYKGKEIRELLEKGVIKMERC